MAFTDIPVAAASRLAVTRRRAIQMASHVRRIETGRPPCFRLMFTGVLISELVNYQPVDNSMYLAYGYREKRPSIPLEATGRTEMPETTDTTTTPTEPATPVDAAAPVIHRSMTRSPSIAALAAAMAKAQGAFRVIEKDKLAKIPMKSGGSYSYQFADLATCLASVRPALAENGIALFQPVDTGRHTACATTMLVHGPSGEWISSDYHAAIGDPSDAKSVGSAATYARRYGLLALLAIAPDDEDDEAGAADRDQPPRGAAQGYNAPQTNDLAAAARARSGGVADGGPPAQGEPYDHTKDADWAKFLAGCKGATLPPGISPGEFLTRWASKMDGAKVKGDLTFGATWIAAGTGLRSPVVRDVVAEMKEVYNLATKRVGGAA